MISVSFKLGLKLLKKKEKPQQRQAKLNCISPILFILFVWLLSNFQKKKKQKKEYISRTLFVFRRPSIYSNRSASSEQDNSDQSEHSEKSPLVSARLDNLARLFFSKSMPAETGSRDTIDSVLTTRLHILFNCVWIFNQLINQKYFHIKFFWFLTFSTNPKTNFVFCIFYSPKHTHWNTQKRLQTQPLYLHELSLYYI